MSRQIRYGQRVLCRQMWKHSKLASEQLASKQSNLMIKLIEIVLSCNDRISLCRRCGKRKIIISSISAVCDESRKRKMQRKAGVNATFSSSYFSI